jgi:hypothetical protein
MKIFISLFISLISLAALAEEKFVTGIESVPLIPGFEVVDGSTGTFDTADGTVTQADAELKNKADYQTALASNNVKDDSEDPEKTIMSLYDKILAEDGWKKIEDNTYENDTEELIISVSIDDQAESLLISYSLASK